MFVLVFILVFILMFIRVLILMFIRVLFLVFFFMLTAELLLFGLERLGGMMFCPSSVMLVILMSLFEFGLDRLSGMMLSFVLVAFSFLSMLVFILLMRFFMFIF